MEHEQIHRIVAAATTAPSGDNCQPWTFIWNKGALEMWHENARARHSINRENHASLLSLGCALELIRIAASHERREALVELGSFDVAGASPWAVVRFRGSAVAPDPLAPFIGKRVTDRRIYRGGSLSHCAFETILETAGKSATAHVHVTDTYPPEFVDYLLQCEEFIWDHPPALSDFLAWIRMNSKEIESSRDGLPWNNLGVNFAEARILTLLRHLPASLKFLKMIGFKHQIRALARKQLKSNAGLICFSVTGTEPAMLVEAGSLALRTWLILTQSNFGVQPLTIASLSAFDFETGALPISTPSEYVDLFSEGRELFKQTFSLPANARPVWAMRVGMSPHFPKEHRTLRKPVSECLQIVHA